VIPSSALWIVGSLVLLSASGLSLAPRVPAIVRAITAASLVGALVVLQALELVPSAPDLALRTLGVVAVGCVAVVGGSAVTSAVLGLAMRDGVVGGQHGGILIASADDPIPRRDRPEVLRGGTAIGYLERFAIVGAALVGHLEIVAAVVAIKGLGRFTELDTAAARERFIVGTLTSSCWAGLCSAGALALV